MTIITQYHYFSNINSKLYVKITLGDIMKKSNLFISILTTLILTILTSFVLAIAYKITRYWSLAYILCYIIMIILLGKYFKEDLIDNFHTFKEDIKKQWLNVLIFTIIFTSLLYLSNYLIAKYVGDLATNEIMSRNQLKTSPLLMSISMGFLGPIVEEIIYRLPYKNVNKHKLLNFFIYTFIFALAHIAITNGIQELLYLIPYTFLSLSIGYGFYKTDNIYVSIIVHILNNLANIVIILFI